MVHRVLKIGRWIVDFLFAERKYDIEGIVSCLRHANAPGRIIDQAVDLMDEGEPNTGFTYSNGIVFRAVVCIGPTSSGAEFQNTLVHEIHHLAVAIASGIGVDLESETPAYLAGDTMREFADVVCHLGCDHCRG
jgi:hypothetical protein